MSNSLFVVQPVNRLMMDDENSNNVRTEDMKAQVEQVTYGYGLCLGVYIITVIYVLYFGFFGRLNPHKAHIYIGIHTIFFEW